MKQLSVLIPTYNGNCTKLVSDLQAQAEELGIAYEIIVADDGSTDTACIEANRAINALPNCRYAERPENAGRAAIRNFLASQAVYPWLLFIDSDMIVSRNDYLQRYAEHADSQPSSILYGGVTIGLLVPGNLRSMYEKAAEHEHTPERRQQSPYRDFHTANFLVPRQLMLNHPFDERFHHYGYEDVLFGKQMEQHAIPIVHIDNPLSFEVFETNADFVSKTEEGLRTLHQFRHELQGYSRLLALSGSQSVSWLSPLIRLYHRLFSNLVRRNLTGSNPSLFLFKLYKLGYFLSL
jgi:glycosyltransferase involved in cell wall biosynthesis